MFTFDREDRNKQYGIPAILPEENPAQISLYKKISFL